MTRAAMTRAAMTARLLALATLTSVGCYEPRPLDTHAALVELESEQRTLGAAPGAPPSAGRALTADEAVALALKYNPELRAYRRQRDVAEGEIVAAGALANPTLDLEWLHVQNPGANWGMTLGWQPPQPGVWSGKQAAARAGADAVRHDIAEQEWAVATGVRLAHAELLAVGEQKRLVERALETRQRIVALVEKRVGGGASTRLDQSLAELTLSQIERERDELAARELLAAQSLALAVGADRPLQAAGELGELAAPPAAAAALGDEAVASRPAVAAAKARYGQREETLRVEHARKWPWFRFNAAPRFRSYDNDNPNDFLLGAVLTVPVLDQNAGPIQVAEAARDQERERFRALALSIRREVATAHAEIALRQETLRRYRERVLPGLEGHEKMLEKASSAGQVDLVALLAAEDVLLKARREHAELRLAHQRAWIRLDRAVGRRVTPGEPAGRP